FFMCRRKYFGRSKDSLLIFTLLFAASLQAQAAFFPFTPISKNRRDSEKKTDSSASAKFTPPKPAPADAKKLPAAFAKTTPASIDDLKAMERHVKTLAARISPAVVAVEVGDGSGSAVIIS